MPLLALTLSAAAHPHLGAATVPFDLARTHHLFHLTPDGGAMTVVALHHDPADLVLIRSHLCHEAAAFACVDFADPTRMHGAKMERLAALAHGARQMQVRFEPLP